MTRELKLALIVGFSLVLVVTVLISDHLSKARQVHLAEVSAQQPALVSAPAAVEPAITVPPPSERQLAARPSAEEGLSLSGAPPAVRTEIVQGVHGGVVTGGPEGLAASGGAGDPDRSLIDQMRGSGYEVVDRGTVRDIVPRDPTAPGSSVVENPPALPERTHAVAEGDSLYKITKQYYGDGTAWKKVAAANGLNADSSLKIGMKIKLPPSEQVTGRAAPASVLALGQAPGKAAKPASVKASEPSRAKFASYVVRKGDTITEIARRQLGSPGRAGEVIRMNESQLEDEDTLQAGMVLKLPHS